MITNDCQITNAHSLHQRSQNKTNRTPSCQARGNTYITLGNELSVNNHLLPLLVEDVSTWNPRVLMVEGPKPFYPHEELSVTGCQGEHASGLHFACWPTWMHNTSCPCPLLVDRLAATVTNHIPSTTQTLLTWYSFPSDKLPCRFSKFTSVQVMQPNESVEKKIGWVVVFLWNTVH